MDKSKAARFVLFATCLLSLVAFGRRGGEAADPRQGEIKKRTAWTTSRISGSPDPPLPYVSERAFPSLRFNHCLDVTSAPGSDRLFVVEQAGKIFSFPADADVKSADLVVDIANEIAGVREVYAIAFHPGFETNRYCFVCYIKSPGLEDGTQIARFRVTDTDPPTIDPASETTIITWLSGGHNGCCLKFGPDGYLYISTGDGVGPNPPDTKQTGQKISDLLSSILRIDVDHADEGRNYRIPRDNPFVELSGARGEVWAYGLRNPWRMSFDRQTGDLWVGDVGWELWEMLDRVERGGNYGWAVMEGRQTTNPEWPRGPTPVLPPTIDHPHSESSSITDGLTYYGSRLQQLYGTHIYGDYDTGKLWGFRYQNGQVVDHRELADSSHRIVGFGEDNNGELYFLDHVAGTLHRLVPNSHERPESDFPSTLSESGLFSSVAQQLPAPGVIRYSINAEPWADHAVAQRLVAVPGDVSLTPDGKSWKFPRDSVFVKTLSLDMERGNPDSRRHLETQILHFDGHQWNPYSYQWNDEQSEATLLGAAGGERVLEIVDEEAPEGVRRQTWRFSSRAECQRCHNKWSGPVLGFNVKQLNRVSQGGETDDEQLDAFATMGLFAEQVPTRDRAKLADPRDLLADRSDRARAYLHVNCAHCHRQNAGGAVRSIMHDDLPLDKTQMVDLRPSQGAFGIHAARVIAPGDPLRSVLLYRMSKLGGGRMPHIGSSEVDRDGVELIYEWLRHLAARSSNDVSEDDVASKLRREETAALTQLCASDQSTEQSALIDRLLSTTSGALMLQRSIDRQTLPAGAATLAIENATKHDELSVRDLFERFLPANKRVRRLGSVVQPEQILAIAGESERGKRVFFETAGVQCRTCHRINERGAELGPDLSTVGKRYSRAQLLESILEPSKVIDPKYLTYIVETTQGRLLAGVLIMNDDNEVALKDAQNQLISIPAEQIERLVPQQRSLMPELLLRDMTPQQVADLLAYLSSLK